MRIKLTSTVILLISFGFAIYAADPPAKSIAAAKPPAVTKSLEPKPLEAQDRLTIREAQLMIAQAQIAKLEAEAANKEAEARIGQIVQALKARYKCETCSLNMNLEWVPNRAPATEPNPAPGGQPSNKE
jgi:hypothetical protein